MNRSINYVTNVDAQHMKTNFLWETWVIGSSMVLGPAKIILQEVGAKKIGAPTLQVGVHTAPGKISGS